MINKFGERLKDLLDERGLKRSALTKATGFGSGIISAWILGKKQPTADSIIKIADYFGVTADYLLGRTDY